MPTPAFRAITRARWATRRAMRRVRYGMAEWLDTPMGDAPADTEQRKRSDLELATAELTFENMFAAYRQAEHGRTRRQVEFWRTVLERDGHLRGMVENRVAAVAGKEWSIVPGGDSAEDEAAREIIEAAMSDIKEFRAALFHLMSCNYFGFAAVEIDWRYQDGIWHWGRLVPVDAEHFCVATIHHRPADATPGELLLDPPIGTGMGERLIPGKWMVATRWGFMPLARAGLMRPVTYYSLFKLSGVKDWGIWSQRFGIPFVTATTINDMPPEPMKRLLYDIVENFGRDGGAAAWGPIEVKAITDTSRNGSDAHSALIQLCNAETAKLVNGGTLTNDNQSAGAASYALGYVHQDIRLELLLGDAMRAENIVEEQMFRPFMHFNRISGRTPRLRLRVMPQLDIATLVKLAKDLTAMGVPCSAEQLREMTTLRAPKNEGDATNQTDQGGSGEDSASDAP